MSGIFVAYAAIGTMAVGPILGGCFSSLDRLKVPHKKDAKKDEYPEYSDSEDDEDDEESEAVTSEDAYMFPVYGSAALFSMYMIFKYLNKDWVNYLLSGYFALIGVAALTQLGVRIAKATTGVKLPLYHLHLVHHGKPLFELRFTNLHLGMLATSAVLTALYLLTKNWLVSNMFGLAFSFSAIMLIRLDSFKSGMIMLAGLFVYDIFWVFGTEVMVSVAKNFDAPIKVVFPRELFPESGELKMTMLGLGDIVVPGIFVALCLRFDRHRYLQSIGYSKDKPLPPVLNGKRRGFAFPTPYFYSCLVAYVIGLATTISVMHVFKAAQPALLYLSPACILSVILTGLARGELGQVFAYNEEADKKKEDDQDKQDKDSSSKSLPEQQQPAATHRYNLRNQPASNPTASMSAGELADDEQEGAKAYAALDDKTNPISETSGADSDASAAQPKKAKRGRKPGSKNKTKSKTGGPK